MEDNRETFSYTYSAKQQEEIQNIRKKYLPREEDKMMQLRRLDQSATRKGMAASLIVGITGALLFGVGTCCCLVWEQYLPGIIIGIAGALVIAAAYPIYNAITKKERGKIAPEIIRLTDELMK